MQTCYSLRAFNESFTQALLTDLRQSFTNFDESHVLQALTAMDLSSRGSLSRLFDRLLSIGSIPWHNSVIEDSLFSLVSKRLGKQRVLLGDVDSRSVQLIRQILGCFRKYETQDVEGDFAQFSARVSASGRPQLRSRPDLLYEMRALISSVLGDTPELSQLMGHHGPGAVYDHAKDEGKWKFDTTTWALLPYGGSDLFHFSNRHWLTTPHELSLQRYWHSRACAVPKDFRGPRYIAIEQKELQFLQQALKEWLYHHVPFRTHHQVQFERQDVHRAWLFQPEAASLDLSDASDYVSRRLVWTLFPEPWRKLLFSLRSTFVVLPSGHVAPIRSFALMGSALCFPVEALVHWACAKLSCSRFVSVYGDDIIVERRAVPQVLENLETCGLRPNYNKTCYRTRFRESCGLDLWADTDCTIQYIRRLPSSVSTALSLVAPQQELWRRGFYAAAACLRKAILDRVSLDTDEVPKHPSVLGGESDIRFPRRWNKGYQRLEVLAPQLVTRMRRSSLDGYDGIYASLAGVYSEVYPTQARLTVRRGWTTL